MNRHQKKRGYAYDKARVNDWRYKVNVEEEYDKNKYMHKAKPGTEEYEEEKNQAKQKGEQFRKGHKNVLDKGAGILYKSKNIEVYSCVPHNDEVYYTINFDHFESGRSYEKMNGKKFSSDRNGKDIRAVGENHSVFIYNNDWHLAHFSDLSNEAREEYKKAYDAIAKDLNDFFSGEKWNYGDIEYKLNITGDQLMAAHGKDFEHFYMEHN